MKQNNPYNPWLINANDFPKRSKNIEEKLKFFVRYAILAPNSHNTQPWKFKISNNTVKIFPDLKRSLIYSDRMHRELHISLGCAAANFRIAALHFGYDTKIEYYSENDIDNAAITIKIKEKIANSPKIELFPFITKRTTNRNPYLDKEIPQDIFIKINEYIKKQSDINVCFIVDMKTRQEITKFVDESIIFAFNDEIFKDELSSWVRSNYTDKPDGMPLFGFGVPGPLSLLAPFLIKHMPAQTQSTIDKNLLKHSSAFMVLSSKEDTKEAWMKTGEIYEYLSLACLKEGIATAPMAGVVEYDKTDKKLQDFLHLKERPLFFARMGYPSQETHKAPRRNLEDVLL